MSFINIELLEIFHSIVSQEEQRSLMDKNGALFVMIFLMKNQLIFYVKLLIRRNVMDSIILQMSAHYLNLIKNSILMMVRNIQFFLMIFNANKTILTQSNVKRKNNQIATIMKILFFLAQVKIKQLWVIIEQQIQFLKMTTYSMAELSIIMVHNGIVSVIILLTKIMQEFFVILQA